MLPDGRLHLQQGPIDCLCRAWGADDEIHAAYEQAARMFPDVLPDLCAELALLRRPLPSPEPAGAVARAMHRAVGAHDGFITPMAAVAGAVADHLLAAMTAGRCLERAFVNNGGDIAFHLAPGTRLAAGLVADLDAPMLNAWIMLLAEHPSRGVATSGRATKSSRGRSFSFGIADSVTVLAGNAAIADAAATVIANEVDLPGHPAVERRPAVAVDPDSDLGSRLITWSLGPVTADEARAALARGAAAAVRLIGNGQIDAAVLCLRGETVVCGPLPELA